MVEEREVYLLVRAPRRSSSVVRFSNIVAVFKSRKKARQYRSALPLMERLRTHIEPQRVRITSEKPMPDEPLLVDRETS